MANRKGLYHNGKGLKMHRKRPLPK